MRVQRAVDRLAFISPGMLRFLAAPLVRRLIDLARQLDTRPTRFLLVGLTGVGVNSAVLWLLVWLVGLPTLAAGFLATVVSTTTNFLLNDAYTWPDRAPAGLRTKAARLMRYYGTTVGGNVIYLALLTILTHRLGVLLLAANVVALGVGGTFNYVGHNLWTWRHEGE